MNSTGNRKIKAFYVTSGCVMIVFITAILKGIQLSGDNLVAIGFILTGLFTAFTGGNAVEHYSKSKAPAPPAPPVP